MDRYNGAETESKLRASDELSRRWRDSELDLRPSISQLTSMNVAAILIVFVFDYCSVHGQRRVPCRESEYSRIEEEKINRTAPVSTFFYAMPLLDAVFCPCPRVVLVRPWSNHTDIPAHEHDRISK